MIELILPYPPSLNHYKRAGRTIVTKRGKIFQSRVNTDATKRFFYEVWYLVKQKQIESLGGAPIALEIDVFPPDKRKRDLDNVLKVTLDALQNAGLFDDDYQVSRLFVERMGIIRQGQIIVRIATMHSPEQMRKKDEARKESMDHMQNSSVMENRNGMDHEAHKSKDMQDCEG